MIAGALQGLRVIDLTTILAGPFCTLMLADHGAEVIKIEPAGGDPARFFPPFRADDRERHFGGYFQSINRNKKSLVLDLKQEAGKALLRRLVEDADVLVENFRAGVMERLELGYESLIGINPRLVYACIRGFGDPRSGKSPYNDWPAYDVVSQAMGGVMAINGPGPAQPTKVGPGVGDTVPAMMMAFGILAAVRHAERTGTGQFLDISMVDSILALCERILHQHSYAGAVPGPEGNAHPLFCPFGMFPAQDGWVTIGCPTDKFWESLCQAMGVAELGTDPRYATNLARIGRQSEVLSMVEGWTRVRTKAELAGEIGGKVPFGPVQDVADIVADAHFAIRRMIVSLEHPGSAEPVRVAGTPIKMEKTPGGVRRRAPLLGEHTREVLAGLGIAGERLEELFAAGVVG